MEKSLGEMLRENMQREENEKREAEERRIREQKEKERKERSIIETFIDGAKDKIVERISRGDATVRIPAKTSNSLQYNYMKITSEGPAFIKLSSADIWYDFLGWLEDAELQVELVSDHDGMGMSSWTTMVINPIVK